MKKATLVILLSAILLLSFTASMVLNVSGDTVADNSIGPAPYSGDGVPDGNQFIRPDNPGVGPAPSSGDGIPDGSGFP